MKTYWFYCIEKSKIIELHYSEEGKYFFSENDERIYNLQQNSVFPTKEEAISFYNQLFFSELQNIVDRILFLEDLIKEQKSLSETFNKRILSLRNNNENIISNY